VCWCVVVDVDVGSRQRMVAASWWMRRTGICSSDTEDKIESSHYSPANSLPFVKDHIIYE
jgi:hypothetical protein